MGNTRDLYGRVLHYCRATRDDLSLMSEISEPCLSLQVWISSQCHTRCINKTTDLYTILTTLATSEVTTGMSASAANGLAESREDEMS